jgi:hypothetical protein
MRFLGPLCVVLLQLTRIDGALVARLEELQNAAPPRA